MKLDNDHMFERYKIIHKNKSMSELLALIEQKTKEINNLETELQAIVEVTEER